MAWACAACSGENPDGMRFCGLCGSARLTPAAEASPAPAASLEAATSMVADALRGLVVTAPAAAPPGAPARPLRDERRLVTAVFADISGYSELTNRLDPEQLLEVIDPVVSALSNVVGRYEGIIEKFAGDALMALFGAPVAHDDDAVRALHVALDMHGELARMVAQLPPAAAGLRLHAGVNSGHGIGRIIGSEVRFDYGVLGDVIVLAQRLEASAPTGETYVGDTTFRLTRKEFDFEPVGELTVKGKAEPVHAWRLIGPRRRHQVRDGERGGEQVLVGRDPELAQIAGFTKRLEEGRGGAVLVLGEPGLGKTALCEAVRLQAANAGWDWLAARCVPYGERLAYGPFAELFRGLMGVDQPAAGDAVARLRSALGELALEETLPLIGALCGVVAPPQGGVPAQTVQTRLHEAVVAVLGAHAVRRPTVLHVDDLHSADSSTVALLRDLLVAAAELPLVVLASARMEAGAVVDELLSHIPGAALTLRLEPLAGEAVRQIARRVLDGPPGAGLVAALQEHTGGNPFFVEEVARSLVDRGALVMRGGQWQTSIGWSGEQVPVTIEGVVAARVDALTEGQRSALDVLSVIGRRPDLRLARAVSPGIDPALPELVAGGLLDVLADDGPGVAFHHPLTLQVVYSRMLRRRRADLHRRVGEAAESLLGADDTTVDLLARHFALGEQPAKAFDYLLRAAERAQRLFANDQAITHLRQAIELEPAATGEARQRTELLLRCAQLEDIRGTYDRALADFDEVWAMTQDVRAGVGRSSTLRKLGEYARCLKAIGEARDAHPRLTPEETAALALEEGRTRSLSGDVGRATAVLEEGLVALDGGHGRLAGRLLVQLARVEQHTGGFGAAVRHAEQARRSLEEADDIAELVVALRVLGGLYHETNKDLEAAELRRAHDTLAHALALARRVGNAEETAACLINLARVLWDMGLTEEAVQSDLDAIEAFMTVGLRAGVACGYCNLAEHLGELERWEETLVAARRGLEVAREIGNDMWVSGALLGSAHALLGLGRDEEALAAAEEATERGLACGHPGRVTASRALAATARAKLASAALSPAEGAHAARPPAPP